MVKRTSLIDPEWADELVGLRLKVPANWWVGYTTRELHDGKITSFDEDKQKWNFELDSEPDAFYSMAYEAVYEYVDEGASTYDDYHLPAEPTMEEEEEEEVVGRGNHRRYSKTDCNDWNTVDVANGQRGRAIEPIPWTGGDEEFTVNATEEEIESFKDTKGEIRFEKLF